MKNILFKASIYIAECHSEMLKKQFRLSNGPLYRLIQIDC